MALTNKGIRRHPHLVHIQTAEERAEAARLAIVCNESLEKLNNQIRDSLKQQVN